MKQWQNTTPGTKIETFILYTKCLFLNMDLVFFRFDFSISHALCSFRLIYNIHAMAILLFFSYRIRGREMHKRHYMDSHISNFSCRSSFAFKFAGFWICDFNVFMVGCTQFFLFICFFFLFIHSTRLFVYIFLSFHMHVMVICIQRVVTKTPWTPPKWWQQGKNACM